MLHFLPSHTDVEFSLYHGPIYESAFLSVKECKNDLLRFEVVFAVSVSVRRREVLYSILVEKFLIEPEPSSTHQQRMK